MSNIITCDPGIGGGVFVPHLNKCFKNPGNFIEKVRLLRDCGKFSIAYIEKVGVMPKDGVRGVWTFSWDTACWYCALQILGIKIVEIPPQTWQSPYKPLPKKYTHRKRALRLMAKELYSKVEKINNTTADAVMIYDYVIKHRKV